MKTDAGKSPTSNNQNAADRLSQNAGLSAPPPSYGICAIDRMARNENRTGLPDNLKSGIEQLSGLSMDDVRVHYNSSKPAPLGALAYTQGTEIHVGPGQEKHLPHEAWHLVQQTKGRVQPTLHMASNASVNDDPVLEREADVMGQKALQMKSDESRAARVENPAKHTTQPSPPVFQLKPITATAGDAKTKVNSFGKKSRLVHLNIQMSGDSRLAVASVGYARKNETDTQVKNGLIVSVPAKTDDKDLGDYDFVDNKLNGLLRTHSIPRKNTVVYSTVAESPHASRQEALNTWTRANGWTGALHPLVYQTGAIKEYVAHYEKTGLSFKSSLEKDYGILENDHKTPTTETNSKAATLGSKLAKLNLGGNVVLWFKGDPTQSISKNSLQSAKTEHWLGHHAGAAIIDRYGTGKVAVAGSLDTNQQTVLGGRLTEDNDFTVSKLKAADLDTMGKQYGFFRRYSYEMTHFGGRSGNLEPLAAMGIKTRYFEEEGNQQAGRDVHIGADNAMSKVVIKGVTGLAGVISKGLSWLTNNGKYRTGAGEATSEQKAYYDKIINLWMNEGGPANDDRRKRFYNLFLNDQDKEKSLSDNSTKFKTNLVWSDPLYGKSKYDDLEDYDKDVLDPDDLIKVIDELQKA